MKKWKRKQRNTKKKWFVVWCDQRTGKAFVLERFDKRAQAIASRDSWRKNTCYDSSNTYVARGKETLDFEAPRPHKVKQRN